MGEIVMGDNTATGGGVVLAQRVEQLADPGSLCITAAVHESLPNRMPFDLKNIGEQTLKGFDDPIRVYRVELNPGASIPPPQQESRSKLSRKSWQLTATIAVVVVVIAIGIAYVFKTTTPLEEPASVERMAFPLPDKPSIAVLPFTNMSNNEEQEFFADGMTEDLITDISKVTGLFVIARNSVFTYKGKAVKVRQVAEELGVRYVMEGSVRRAGNKVRVNAQLIDATTGGHLWADRYDGSLDDVFAMQDQITQSIVTALAVTLKGEDPVMESSETGDTEAYDAYLKGWEYYRRETPDDFAKAIELFERALELDPDYENARTALAAVYWNSTWRRWIRSSGFGYSEVIDQARRHLKEAMKSPSALTHQIASEMATNDRRSADHALFQAELAISIDSNDPAGHLARANALLKDKRPEEALLSMQRAMRLDPHYPAFYLTRLGRVKFDLGLYEEAAATLAKSTNRNSQDDRAFMYLAAAYGYLDKQEKATTALKSTNDLRAKAGWGRIRLNDVSYIKWVGDRKRLRAGLKKAGVESGYDWYSLITQDGDEYEVKGATKIDLETAKQLYDRDVPFIDTHILYIQEHIQGAHFLNWYRGSFSGRQREFNEVRLSEIVGMSEEVVVYGHEQQDGPYSSAFAVSMGFEKVYYFDDFDDWKAAGYPVETRNQK